MVYRPMGTSFISTGVSPRRRPFTSTSAPPGVDRTSTCPRLGALAGAGSAVGFGAGEGLDGPGPGGGAVTAVDGPPPSGGGTSVGGATAPVVPVVPSGVGRAAWARGASETDTGAALSTAIAARSATCVTGAGAAARRVPVK